MQNSDLPVKFSVPWANSASPSYIRQVPTASQISVTPGAASLTDGFPPLCAIPVAAGGIPPFMQDINGLLNQTTAWLRWLAAGGPITFDAAFQTTIGGYPVNAVVSSATITNLFWRSTTNNNVSNPDNGGAGWVSAFGGRLLNVQTFSTAGLTTYTPTPGTNMVIVEVQGAGGAGGGAVAAGTGNAAAGVPGASGAYGRSLLRSGFAGQAVLVGAKGTSGSGILGGNGGASSFANISAPGGYGGGAGLAQSSSASGGNGSLVNATGANLLSRIGACAHISFGFTTGQAAIGGGGGESYFGPGGLPQQANLNGNAAISPGGGGGGTIGTNNTGALTGGNGADGIVIISEYA